MPLSPDEFYARAMDAADAEGRLPLSRMTGWEIRPLVTASAQAVNRSASVA